ncbi:MAG: oligoendopeptidase F [Acidobacteria bacterium]|nr:oligoendopeptidase F [Acidobacteriota bacterium]
MGRMVVTMLLLGAVMTGAAAANDAKAVAERHRWNLDDLYPSSAEFDAARKALAGRLPGLEEHRGRLSASPAAMKAALDAFFGVAKDLNRISSFAGMRSDEDTRVAATLGARQEVQQLSTEFAARTSWLAPEVLALPAGTVEKFLAAEPGLAPYRFFLLDLERQRAHTLSPAEEKLLAQAGLVAPAASSLYGVLHNADMPFPDVTLSDGTKVRLDSSAYTKYRALPNRDDRILVFREFWRVHREFERTFGVALDAQTKRDLFYARARNYDSCLAAALDGGNVPESVYRTLISEANRALPTLYRAFKLRSRLLGIPDLAYHDIYPPLVPSLKWEFPIETGERLVVDAVMPLGREYAGVVEKGFASRWMDAYPQPGKRSGAYSNGSAYDVHPYVLMNYNDDYESVSTLAHEWGHAMHSSLANAAQPYPTADYSIFVAEVASTFNEALLLKKMLGEAKTDDERLYLLGSYLEGLRGTFFRQAMFAEFELAIHEAAERGEALTGEKLSAMYGELLRRYHGHDAGVVRIDDAYTVEWAYIPHFYYNFYVYQYATSLAASTQLAREVIDGKPGARERYLGLLKAGGSRYPYELLKEAGVDLASPAPYRALEAQMNWAMDEIEKLVATKK